MTNVETDAEIEIWIDVCAASAITPDRGVAAIIGSDPVAIFKLTPGDDRHDPSSIVHEWLAVGHIDPISGAPIIARGLVGSVGEPPLVVPTVASPLHKQRYNLRTGFCLDDATARLAIYDVRTRNGRVEVRLPSDR